jgi:pimeloyl-ACP methyl ester carboxylesterase
MAAVALAGLVGVLTLATAAAEVPVPVLEWQPCPEPTQRGFDCAIAQVPLDYGDPQGATIDLAVIRLPAADPAQRIGALFLNFGGPGAAGTVELLGAMPLARFDLISWDPRGVGASTAVQCFDTPDDAQRFFAALPEGFPVGGAEQRAWIRGYARLGELCAERNGGLLAHVSTAETARDLDLLRQAVGDPQLNYQGNSYGTFLGAVYANLFPDKVRAMVLFGNIDPVGWTDGGEDDAFLSNFLRRGVDKASAQVLDAFLTLCGQASTAQCAFSAGNAAATQAKWTTLLQRVRKQPVTMGTPPRTLTYAALVSTMIENVLYNAGSWPQAAELLQTLWTSREPSGPLPAPHAAVSSPAQEVENRVQAFAVQCAESPNPRHPGVFRALAAQAYARAGDVGRYWAWIDEPCARWPATAAARYAGPWDRPTANPVLVINNTHDPATPGSAAAPAPDDAAGPRDFLGTSAPSRL